MWCWCGLSGNVRESDVRRTISALPHLCARDATVIWTRHRRTPDLTPTIRGWLAEAAFAEVAFDTEEPFSFASARLDSRVGHGRCDAVRACSSSSVGETPRPGDPASSRLP